MRLTAILFLLSCPALAADLAPHRAEYDLEVSMEAVGTVARGAYLLDIDRTCDAWVVNDRMEASGAAPSGQALQFLFRSSTLEAADGSFLQFDRKAATPLAAPSHVSGQATREADGVVVAFETPEPQTLTLKSDTLFPSGFAAVLVNAALAGEERVAIPVFGGDDQVPDTEVVSWMRPTEEPSLEAEGAGAMEGQRFWALEIAHYDRDQPDALPIMVQQAVMAENGALLTLDLIAGPIVFAATARQFEWYDDPGC